MGLVCQRNCIRLMKVLFCSILASSNFSSLRLQFDAMGVVGFVTVGHSRYLDTSLELRFSFLELGDNIRGFNGGSSESEP